MWNFDEMVLLCSMVKQVNALCNDEYDEVKIKREDGSIQGIFKTWALPVIPLLDSGKLGALFKILPHFSDGKDKNFSITLQRLINNGNEDAIIVNEAINEWSKRVLNDPYRLERAMERARLNSWLMDKKLTMAFCANPLDSYLPNRIRELIERLLLALGLLSPFYNLELISGDSRLGLGIELPAKNNSAGLLDIVPFLLPAAFRDILTADQQNWNGLNWKKLSDQVQWIFEKDKTRSRIILNISRIAGIPPHHVLFAANALEWIPTKVGGKKSDPIATKEAIAQLDEILSIKKTEIKDSVSVLAEINALIRFLNWAPLIEGEENFRGKNWTYASVCDTSSLLFDTICAHPEVWQDEFRKIFEEKLKPQLQDLDVASAKGRFLLHLIVMENKLKSEYFSVFNHAKIPIANRISQQLSALISPDSTTRSVREISPINLVGGKSFGLALAAAVIPDNVMTDGFVLSSDQINSFLKDNGFLWQEILKLDAAESIEKRLELSKKIQQVILESTNLCQLHEILRAEIKKSPQINLWAVRSSALNEGEARGIYKTSLRVNRAKIWEATLQCIASYYSKEALHFRTIMEHDDIPDFAVLIQPYKEAKGGVASVIDDDYIISIGISASSITAGEVALEEIKGKISSGKELPSIHSSVKTVLKKLNDIFSDTQIEWLRDSNNSIMVLQMEFLPRAVKERRIRKNRALRAVTLSSLTQVNETEKALKETNDDIIMKIDKSIDLNLFNGELLGLLARFGKRIAEIHFEKTISSSSHLANICRHFGITIK